MIQARNKIPVPTGTSSRGGSSSHLPSLRTNGKRKESPSSPAATKSNSYFNSNQQICAKSDNDSVLIKPIMFDSRLFCSMKSDNEHVIIESKPFENDKPNEFIDLFLKKCTEISFIVSKEENIKKKVIIINQLISAFNFPNLIRKINQKCCDVLIKAVTKNIVRNFPFLKSISSGILFDRVDNYCDTQWPTIKLFYQLLESFLTSPHVPFQLLQQTLTKHFIKKVFNCFESPDVRERLSIKNILYIIVGRIPERGNYVVQLIQHTFYNFLFDEKETFGISQLIELLESIFTSIIQFNSNMNFYDDILKKYILPLHRSSDFISFSSQIISLMKVLLTKNPKEINSVIIYILNHFPITSQKKQVVILKEISEIVDMFWQCLNPLTVKLLFKKIIKCFNNECSEISEISLSLIYKESFQHILEQCYMSIVPKMYIKAKIVVDNHWSDNITFVALATIQEISKIDNNSFNIILSNICSYNQRQEVASMDRKNIWRDLIQCHPYNKCDNNDSDDNNYCENKRNESKIPPPRSISINEKDISLSRAANHNKDHFNTPNHLSTSQPDLKRRNTLRAQPRAKQKQEKLPKIVMKTRHSSLIIPKK
ncbi:hypothetical protein TRFO_16120 [Tritrichomonas foetus]|uniref:Uncharacterized protein n=1 Tax=Tritrichomonas foetus TaxID=1144522 RepID=A0A1J4KVZ6_9EUKA|nr:hypothetical protein TRFO_16120 [Tritrichomonas foetus]|eukprot:OHT13685.1 hypothetical protein TRFO_16120 [Tritrichomonas foetus]